MLVELNISQSDVDDVKSCSLGPEEEVYVTLKDWILLEDECIILLEGIGCSVDRLTQITDELRQSTLQQQNNMEVLLRSIISDDDFLQKLAKHNFWGKIRSKVKFFPPGTREWLLNDVGEWFHVDDNNSRMLFLTAGPGFGKSVFAAKICEDFKKNGKLDACHFCDFSDSNLKNPMMMLQLQQMCENIPPLKRSFLIS